MEASTQLAKVLQDEITSNIVATGKEQLTKLATIFNAVSTKITNTDAEQYSTTSNPTPYNQVWIECK